MKRDTSSAFSEWRHTVHEQARMRTLLAKAVTGMLRHRQAVAFGRWHRRITRRHAVEAGVERRRAELATLAFGGWRHVLRKAKAVDLQQQNASKLLSR